MTKVARLFEEEKEQAVEQAVEQSVEKSVEQAVINMLKENIDEKIIIRVYPQVSLEYVRNIKNKINLKIKNKRKEVIIKFDFSNGPIWKDKYDISTGEWSTGIALVDSDKALAVLNEEAQKEYISLYSFDENGSLVFDDIAYEEKKGILLSLVKTIKLRLIDLNDGSFNIIDYETYKLQTL